MEINSEFITLFSVFVNVILVGIVIFQYRLSLRQYETVNRPWLVLSQNGKTPQDLLRWQLENIGNLPAKEITITSKPEFEYKEKIIPEIKEEPIKIGIIMPKQKYNFSLAYAALQTLDECPVPWTVCTCVKQSCSVIIGDKILS